MISRIQALSTLLNELPGIKTLTKPLAFELAVRVRELQEINMPNFKQKELLQKVIALNIAIEDLAEYLNSYI